VELRPILNSQLSLETLLISLFFYLKLFFSKVSEARNSQVTFAEKPQMKINSFGKQNGYLIQILIQIRLSRVLL